MTTEVMVAELPKKEQFLQCPVAAWAAWITETKAPAIASGLFLARGQTPTKAAPITPAESPSSCLTIGVSKLSLKT